MTQAATTAPANPVGEARPTTPTATLVVVLTPEAGGAEPAAITAASPRPPAPCDLVAPGLPIDVSIQDGTQLSPGTAFSKTWRLVNAGNCAWTRDYAIVWFSGQQLGILGAQNLPAEVGPGQSIDLTVDMVAPEAPGVYQSNWKLKNPEGELFGLGPNGNAPFWVQIEVAAENTATPEQAASPLPTLPVFASNIASMVYDDNLDLDTGELNREGEDDVAFRLGLQGHPEIAPQNNARIAVFGSQVPSELDCQNAALGINSLPLTGEAEDVYLCYRTNRALPGYMHVQQPVEEPGLISVDFVTWSVP